MDHIQLQCPGFLLPSLQLASATPSTTSAVSLTLPVRFMGNCQGHVVIVPKTT